MSNSPLVSHVNISPNKTSPRNHIIDTITIHCTAGRGTAESIGSIFAPVSRQASSNYGIGEDGRIGMYVEEKDRSWCSSSDDNDHRAITIECSSDATHPYAINDVVYESLINLCVDICKRNNIKKLLWKGDKSLIGQVDKQNMTVHRWFAAKACPGDYIYSRLGKIADEVNKRLEGNTYASGTKNDVIYRVQTGAFSKKTNADDLMTRVKAAGFDCYMVKTDGVYKIQVGAFSKKENAGAMVKCLKDAGFDTFITTNGGEAVSSAMKSIDEIAQEVIKGLWGNGEDRMNRLAAAGYDYNAVQAKVNELL